MIPGYPWLHVFYHKILLRHDDQWEEQDGYSITEINSGCAICRCSSKDEGIQKVIALIEKHGETEFKARINRACEYRRMFIKA